MARNLAVTYPNRAAAGTIDYPYGLFRNVTINGDGTGTPLEATWLNDWNGFFQAILIDANIIPNGTTDTGLSSQYLQALKKMFRDVGFDSDRPTLDSSNIGFMYFDKTLGHPIWWDGTNWVDSSGSTV